jgi:hypothetical protein
MHNSDEERLDGSVATGRYIMKKEPFSFHAFMDSKIMTFYSVLNHFLPSLIRINGLLFSPRIVTYNVIVLDDLAIKEADGGETLLNWMKNKKVENLKMFALSFLRQFSGPASLWDH